MYRQLQKYKKVYNMHVYAVTEIQKSLQHACIGSYRNTQKFTTCMYRQLQKYKKVYNMHVQAVTEIQKKDKFKTCMYRQLQKNKKGLFQRTDLNHNYRLI